MNRKMNKIGKNKINPYSPMFENLLRKYLFFIFINWLLNKFELGTNKNQLTDLTWDKTIRF
jgi:hypothetical protein